MTDHKMVLVKRKTRLEELIVRYNTIQQAQFYIERLGADFSDYMVEDRNYRQAVTQAIAELESFGRVQVIEREHVPNFIFGKQDTVIVLGQDGLVANTLKYVTGQPLIGVNPDPLRWDGVLLPFTVQDLRLILPEALANQRMIKEVTLAKAELNDGQSLYGVNDLFVGRKTHVSARYELRIDQQVEYQSSSGVIISTGLGATGWFKSVLAGASGIVGSATYQQVAQTASEVDDHTRQRVLGAAKPSHRPADWKGDEAFAWDSPSLYFTVREPFPSRTTAAELVFGQIDADCPLRITSQMPENGVIFSDGVENDFLEFNAGVEATIGLAEKRGYLVV